MTTQLAQIAAVKDAIHEASLVPELAGDHPGTLSDRAIRDALRLIPEEHHQPGATLVDRFVGAVVANAAAVGRSPYTVALYALDVA